MSNFKLTPIEEDSSASFRLTPVESPSRSVADIVGDIGVTALKGAISLPEAFVGLADIPTGGSVGKALAEAGYRPDEAKKTLDTLYSDAQQEANRKVQSADGFVETLKTAVDNPSTIATAVGESLPSMIGGAGIARGILKAAPKVAPFIAGAAGEGIIGAGSAAESIRNETSDKLLTPVQSASAVASGVGTSVLGAVGGKIAAKLGVADVDTMLAKGAGQASKAGFMRQVVGSGISEGAFEELPQSMQEQMWQNFATGKPIGEGVGNAGAMGLLSGAAMGGAGGGYNAFTGKNVSPDNPATPPAAEPEKTPDIQTAMAKADGFIRLGELDSIAEDRPLNAAEQGEYQTLLTKLNEEDHGQDATTADAQMDSPSVEGGRIELPGSGNVLVPVSDSDAGNPDVSAGVAETGMREAAPVGAPGAPSLTTRAQPTTTRVLDQQPAELTLPKLSPVHADKVSSIDTRINEIAQDLPTRSKAVQKSLQREAEALAKEKEGVIAQAHADEGADPELMAQYNAAKTAGNHDEMRRLAHEINGQKRKKAPEAKPAERAEGLTLGTAPNAADPVSVRNGVVYVGNYPAQDFDSGEDVRVSADATPFQIRDALTKAGAIGRGQKMFGLPAETKAPKQSKQDRKKLDASKDSLFMAIAKLGGMDTQELIGNGFDKNDITQEAAGRVSKKGKNAGKLGKKSRKPIAMGFAMPLHKNGGMSFDGMLEALKQHGYFGEDATKNDAIDAFRTELGGEKYLTPDAQMQKADQDQAEYDAMMAAEQDRIDAENAAEEAAKEESGYDDLSEEAQDIADDFPDFGDIDNPAGAQSEEDAMRALGFTEEEINEQTGQSAESGNESVAGKGSDAAEGRADSDRSSGVQDGQGQGEVPEGAKPVAGNEKGGKGRRSEVTALVPDQNGGFALAGQTPAEVKAQEAKRKADEIQWTGINDWLDMQTGKVSKADVLAYLDANGVQVQEVVKGDKPRPDDYQEATFEEAKQAAEADKYVVNQWGGRIRQDRAHLMAPDDKYYVAKTEVSGPTKYATYVLPGGENYRELLLTLPVVQRIPTFEQWNESREFRGDTPGTKEQYDNDVGFYAKRGTYGDRSSQFRSSHWDEPNILAHIRYNDRIDADGNRVLFIEELQSDWGQAGKKQGFGGLNRKTNPLAPGEYVEFIGRMKAAAAEEINRRTDGKLGKEVAVGVVDSQPLTQIAEWAGMEAEYREIAERNLDDATPSKNSVIPAAPFVTDTKAWVALAVKRMIAHAAQNGYDKVAFVTGEQSAERYDLSKQINMASAIANKDGTYNLIVEGKSGEEIAPYSRSGKKVTASEMEDVIGKDLTKKLIEGADRVKDKPWPKSSSTNPAFFTVRGLDLKVGGEGMKAFYDTIVPQVVNDVLKKVGGGKVESVAIPRNGRTGRSMRQEDVASQRKEGTLTDQPGLTITPAMREKAGSGLPLFARRETSGKINLQDLDAVASSMSREFPGVPIITVEDERQLPKALRDEIKKADASGDVSGVFHAGKIYLIQSNIKDIEDAQVRAVHEVVHAGLSAMGVSDETFLNIGVSNPKLHSEARKIKAKYGYSFVTSIEESMADMGPAARKLAGWKRVIANVRDKLRKLGFVRKWSDNDVEFLVLRALRMMKQKDSAVVSNKAMYSSLSANHNDEALAFAAEFVNELAIEDDAFRYAISKSKTLEGNLADALPGVEYLGEDTRPDEREESGADHRFVFAMPNEKIFYVYTKGKEVWIDVSRLLQGDEGSAVYHGVANYAYNTGKTFIGDPQGLSEDAVIRRTGAMLSSAVRFGTTSHLGASREQMNGDPAKGIEPLAWRGDDVAKTKALIHTYLKTLQNLYPEIIGSYYDFASGEFRDSTHRPLRWLRRDSGGDSNGQEVGSLGAGGSNLVSREARAGKTSVRRGILLQSLMASESSQRPELLGHVLRRSTQLASKAGGPFNALFSRADQGNGNGDNRAVAGGIPGNNGNALPAETRVEAARRQGQDKFLRFKVVQDWLKAQGVNVSDLSNVYRAETLMHGRVSTRIEDFREKHLQPLIKRIQKAGFALTDIAEYLEAKHTPEANQKQREIHKDPEATAAGVSDADALATVQKWEASPKFAEFAAMADEVRSISDQTRDMLVKAGILSPEMAEAWQKAYQHYVPLKGGPVEPSAKIGAGPGLSVKAKQKRRLGHGQRDEFVIENIIAAHEKAIRQVEKNRVGRTLALLLNEANNEEVGTISKPAKRQVLKETASYEVLYHGTVVEAFHNLQDARNFVTNESGRQNRSPSDFVVTKSTDPIVTMMASPMLAENEAVYYLHGKEVRLQLNDPYLARAYKNLGVEDLGKFLSIGRDINSWLSKAYTGYNPEFLLVNIVRDFTAGLANMTGDYGAGFALNVVKNYPAAMKAMWKSKDGNYTQLIKEYRDDGGSTGAAYLSDLERVGNNLQRAYDDARGMQATWKAGRKLGAGRVAVDKSIAWVMTYVEHLNRVGENAMRVALYQTLRESGKPRAEAAEAAKNVTVNFNRKGEVAAQAGAMYLFFNPNVQGTAKLLETMLKSPHKKQAWAMIGAMAGMAFMLANLGRGDDEDEWRNIPSHVKDRNMVLKFGDTQVTLPVPYGYGFFHMIGNAMSDLAHGVNAGKVAMNLTSGFFEHFSPVGNPFAGDEANSKNLVQLLPTLARIPGEIAVNRTGLGGPVMPEKSEWDKHKPDSQTMFRTTKGGFLAQTAEAMNDATGGTKYASGAVDVSPETLKYLIRTTTGGTGTFIGDSLGLAYRGAQGATPELREIPIVRKFVREETIQDVRRRYYEATDEAKKATNELAAAKRNHDPEGVRTIVEDKRELIAMGRVADKMRKSVAAQRDAQDRIMQDEELTLPEKRSRVKALENEEAHLYNRYLKLFQQKEEERSTRKAVNQ